MRGVPAADTAAASTPARSTGHACPLDGTHLPARTGPYSGGMLFFLFILVVVAAVVAYKFRLPILAKLLGQSQTRVQRALDRKKRQ
jgi:hypothetical protein